MEARRTETPTLLPTEAEARTLLPTAVHSKTVNEARTPSTTEVQATSLASFTYGFVIQTPQVRIEEYTDLDLGGF